MEDLRFVPGKSRRKAPRLTNFHYYRVDLYFQVLDTQLKELNDRFNEVNTELLLCMACLSPVNNFASFDKAKIVRLAQLYPQDFDCMDLMNLSIQLDNYIHDMKMHSEFSLLRGIGDLAKELVKTGSGQFAGLRCHCNPFPEQPFLAKVKALQFSASALVGIRSTTPAFNHEELQFLPTNPGFATAYTYTNKD
ncbi:uncharacterized protein LOC126615384 [Malus sylvestris]|uniref:uncharacterized protein LOC126615384 n=1 Tax=Malus sylvestris TaxID=3752 RepID=UPI0021ACF892|nr:uncharacterized protein LOC126615384 [Malus sylvestris]